MFVIFVFPLFPQVSVKLAAKIDIVVLSGAGSKTPIIAERVNSLTADSAARCNTAYR